MSAWEDCCLAVPKGQGRIAQRFNAGLHAKRSRVPKGRLRSNPTRHPSAVPSGLACHAGCFPALKRRAILRMSLRDKGTWRPPFQPSKQPDSFAMTTRRFRGHGAPPGRSGKGSFPRCPAEKDVGHVRRLAGAIGNLCYVGGVRLTLTLQSKLSGLLYRGSQNRGRASDRVRADKAARAPVSAFLEFVLEEP